MEEQFPILYNPIHYTPLRASAESPSKTHNSNLGQLDTARHIFDKMSKRTVVSWNAMISGYSNWGQLNNILPYFTQGRTDSVYFVVLVIFWSSDVSEVCTYKEQKWGEKKKEGGRGKSRGFMGMTWLIFDPFTFNLSIIDSYSTGPYSTLTHFNPRQPQ